MPRTTLRCRSTKPPPRGGGRPRTPGKRGRPPEGAKKAGGKAAAMSGTIVARRDDDADSVSSELTCEASFPARRLTFEGRPRFETMSELKRGIAAAGRAGVRALRTEYGQGEKSPGRRRRRRSEGGGVEGRRAEGRRRRVSALRDGRAVSPGVAEGRGGTERLARGRVGAAVGRHRVEVRIPAPLPRVQVPLFALRRVRGVRKGGAPLAAREVPREGRALHAHVGRELRDAPAAVRPSRRRGGRGVSRRRHRSQILGADVEHVPGVSERERGRQRSLHGKRPRRGHRRRRRDERRPRSVGALDRHQSGDSQARPPAHVGPERAGRDQEHVRGARQGLEEAAGSGVRSRALRRERGAVGVRGGDLLDPPRGPVGAGEEEAGRARRPQVQLQLPSNPAPEAIEGRAEEEEGRRRREGEGEKTEEANPRGRVRRSRQRGGRSGTRGSRLRLVRSGEGQDLALPVARRRDQGELLPHAGGDQRQLAEQIPPGHGAKSKGERDVREGVLLLRTAQDHGGRAEESGTCEKGGDDAGGV
ncbi:hypothetical protein ACHAWF_002427 [Thalassiosira exigua]